MERRSGNKYGAKSFKDENGRFWASQKEYKRYCELTLLEKAGEITNLELQPRFFFIINGVAVRYDSGRQILYKADFSYFDKRRNKRIIEDVKGFRTKEYKLKKAFVHALWPGTIIEEI